MDNKALLALCLLIVRRRRRRRENRLQRLTSHRMTPRTPSVCKPPKTLPIHKDIETVPSSLTENEAEEIDATPVELPKSPIEVAVEPDIDQGDAEDDNMTHGDKPSRKYWIHPSLADNTARNHCKQFHSSLREDPEKFRQHYHVSIKCFDGILACIEPRITGRDTFMRDAVDPETKLAATLRFLVNGSSFRVISEEFLLGRSTVALIVRAVCNAIWMSLRKESLLELPTVDEFLKISEDIERKTDFPHCLGAVGGRYIKIKISSHTSSKNSNDALFTFPKHFAVAFVALVDSNYFFRYVDVSGYKQEKDLLKATSLGASLITKSLDLPPPEPVSGFPHRLPYAFVSNDFTLGDSVMGPFRQKSLDINKERFNQSMEKTVAPFNSALILLTSRWHILRRPFETSVEAMENIVKACCVLHNYIGQHDGFQLEENLEPCCFDYLEDYPKASMSRSTNTRSLFVNFLKTRSEERGLEKNSETEF